MCTTGGGEWFDRVRAFVWSAAVLACLGACRPGTPRRSETPAGAQRLVGVWEATFVLDAPPLDYDSTALRAVPEGRVRGTFAFVPNHWLPAAASLGSSPPTSPAAYGTYDVDFNPFGFDPRNPDHVPEVVVTTGARAGRTTVAGADSVMLVLDPASERTRMSLAGAWHADSVVGTWQLVSTGRAVAAARGHFVLTRVPAGLRHAPPGVDSRAAPRPAT